MDDLKALTHSAVSAFEMPCLSLTFWRKGIVCALCGESSTELRGAFKPRKLN